MQVYWAEQTETDVSPENAWLSAAELARLAGMRFAKRRDDWRLGRWTAKCAVSAYLGLPATSQALRELEIRPASSGAPEVLWANRPAVVTISLSHRSRIAVCAVASACDPAVAPGSETPVSTRRAPLPEVPCPEGVSSLTACYLLQITR